MFNKFYFVAITTAVFARVKTDYCPCIQNWQFRKITSNEINSDIIDFSKQINSKMYGYLKNNEKN